MSPTASKKTAPLNDLSKKQVKLTKLIKLIKKLKGFTLVELLVVLAVLSIIGLVVMATLTESRARSRDSRRVSDIQTLHQALAMHLDSNQYYPIAGSSLPGMIINGTDSVSAVLRNNGILMVGLIDPRDGATAGSDVFHYYYYSSDGKTYTITYCLETESITGQSAGCGNTITQ